MGHPTPYIYKKKQNLKLFMILPKCKNNWDVPNSIVIASYFLSNSKISKIEWTYSFLTKCTFSQEKFVTAYSLSLSHIMLHMHKI